MNYSAREAYQTEASARGYEQRSAYKGYIGRRRVAIERAVIGNLVEGIAHGSTVLDCPCGNGRWLATLSKRAGHLVARDISEGMVRAATERASSLGIPIDVKIGDAEHLEFAEGGVDYTFSYALMKHLPTAIQAHVLREYARVSARGVICSFALFKPLSRAWWTWNRPVESYPLTRDELQGMTEAAGLKLEKLVKVSQPIVGLEYFAVLSRRTQTP
jgi:ubiquinone/menaquinone biosynthesis C-methylase UbiE